MGESRDGCRDPVHAIVTPARDGGHEVRVNGCRGRRVSSVEGAIDMKRILASTLIALSLGTAACTVAVRPPRPGMVLVEGVWVVPPRLGAVWIPGHYERARY